MKVPHRDWRRTRRHAVRWIFGSAVLSLSAGALAQGPATILRVPSSNPTLDKRLDAELSSLGFVLKTVDAEDAGADLGSIARANGAPAGIRVDPGDVVELWIEARRAGDLPVHETVQVDARRGWTMAAVAALEALRAHLLQIRSEPPPAPPAPSPPLDAVAPNPPPAPSSPAARVGRPMLWLHVAGGVDASPGGIPPSVEALLEIRVEPVRWLSLAAFGAGTPAGVELDAPEGKATARRILAGGAIDIQKHLARVTLAVGAGFALVPTFVHGDAPAAGYAARDTSSLTAAPLLRTSLSLAVAPVLRVRLALAAGVTFPESTVTFGDREVASWGRPFGLLTLGVEAGAFR